MPALFRTTSSGACASCGAYGATQHRPICQPEAKRVFRLSVTYRARRDSRFSAAAIARRRVDHERLCGL